MSRTWVPSPMISISPPSTTLRRNQPMKPWRGCLTSTPGPKVLESRSTTAAIPYTSS
jgi:hypothetical protein